MALSQRPTSAAGVHEALTPVHYLLGHWVGEGQVATLDGDEPVVVDLWFESDGTPIVQHRLRWWDKREDGTKGRPRGAEVGYWRFVATDGAGRLAIESVLSHATGHVEIAGGEAEKTRVHLHSTAVTGTATAGPLQRVERFYGMVQLQLGFVVEVSDVAEGLMVPKLSGLLDKTSSPFT